VRPAGVLFVAPAQFVHEMLEVRGKTRRIGPKALLQPFAHGIADRSARLVIHPFAAVVDSADHDEFHLLSIPMN
jgi:hypothetical protein